MGQQGGEEKEDKTASEKRQDQEPAEAALTKTSARWQRNKSGWQQVADDQQPTAAGATNDNSDKSGRQSAAAALDGPPPPRRPRPVLLRRHIVIGGEPAPIDLGAPGSSVGVAPPRRPAYLPARHRDQLGGSPQTSLGATISSNPRPNRYAWAQMQQWQAAAELAKQQALAAGDRNPFAGYRHPPPPDASNGGATGTGFMYQNFASPFASAASRVMVAGNPITNLSEHTKSRLIKFIEAIKRFSEKWFSHVLLLLFLAVYACLGAYVFLSFEATSEQLEKQLLLEARMKIVNDSFDEAQTQSKDDFVDIFKARFEDYERQVNKICVSGLSTSELENQWTFWGALFYSMTVFTTIGYGHLTPITFAGRVATMIYAIFGIPILLMVLADLGKLLTRLIKFAFIKFRYLYNKLLGRKRAVRTRKLIADNTNQYLGVARGAFERGIANYIQPYYHQRVPSAFRRAGPSHSTDDELNQSNKNNNNNLESNMEFASGGGGLFVNNQPKNAGDPRMESSGVIVTPHKQTKPVSPTVNNTKKSPMATLDHSHKDHHHHHQHAKRSQSPSASQHKRKISGNKIGNLDSSIKRSQAGGGKASVSRSSSSSNVICCSSSSSTAVANNNNQSAKKPSSTTTAPGSTINDAGQQQQQLEDAKNKRATDNSEEPKSINSDDAVEVLIDEQQFQEEEIELERHVEGDDYEDDFDIPVSFALFLLITYMMLGAVVFSIWEGWGFFDSLYFVFISMSTIGFGDLVPKHPKRMIGTFAYLLFGLALTSMCINVVQEKIHATFLRAKMQIGEKMGFDLDQIMADDYYDSGSGYDDSEPPPHQSLIDDSAETQSVANSQQTVYSSSLVQPGAGEPNAQASGDTNQQQQIAARSKRRADGHSGGWSFRRKSFSTGKRSHSQKQPNHQAPLTTTSPPIPPQPQPQLPPPQPTPSQLKETNEPMAAATDDHDDTKRDEDNSNHRSLDDLQQANESKSKMSIDCSKDTTQIESPKPTDQPIAPDIQMEQQLPAADNQPDAAATASLINHQPGQQPTDAVANQINHQPPGMLKNFLGLPNRQPTSEHPTTAPEQQPQPSTTGPATRLTTSQSQPDGRLAAVAHSHYAPNNWRPNNHQIQLLPYRQQATLANPSPINHHHRHQASFRVPPSSSGARAGHPATSPARPESNLSRVRSLGSASPRRASVSNELSQLDDLIVALEASRAALPERFGPLLGIPSAASGHSSRSSSPTMSINSTGRLVSYGGGGGGGSGGRRGTSMTSRSVSSTPRPSVQKKRSLNSAASQMRNSASAHRLLLGDCDSSPNFKSSKIPLNLSESQAALDELEAIKLSNY